MTAFLLVSEHLPEREGTASGRLLRAAADGLVAAGHDVHAVCWTSRTPVEQLPAWASWQPLAPGHRLRDHLLALVRPRWASAALRLDPGSSTVSLAEDPLSFAAIAGHPRTAAVVHYSALLDAQALGRVTLRDLQGHRADRRALRRADCALTYSQRVAARWGGTWIPAGIELAAPLPLVEQPRALLLAGWDWPPNRAALQALLRDWPSVAVPGAELLLAGRGTPEVTGATVLGEVPTAREAFAQAAVLAFPCPPSTGPKVKVLEAMAAGLPVVTTPDGVEGLAPEVAAAAEVVPLEGFAAALARVLADPARRADLASRAHAAVALHHSPAAAAAARVAALT